MMMEERGSSEGSGSDTIRLSSTETIVSVGMPKRARGRLVNWL